MRANCAGCDFNYYLAVCPGDIDTPMLRGQAQRFGLTPPPPPPPSPPLPPSPPPSPPPPTPPPPPPGSGDPDAYLRSLLQSYPQGDKARFITAQEASAYKTSRPFPFHLSLLPRSPAVVLVTFSMRITARHTLKHFPPLQVAGLVFYLAQDEAAAITGSNVWRVCSCFCTRSPSRALVMHACDFTRRL